MKMPTLVRPVRAPTRIVEGVEGPSGRIIELPHADLTIGSSDGPLTLTGPYFGDESGSTVVRAWIGMDTGRGQQWWPPEGGGDTGITGSHKVLMAEGFDGGYGYATWNQHYWVGDWAPGSYPTTSPSGGGSWGSRRTWPVPTGGNPARVGACGVDWNPFTQVLVVVMGEYNYSWPGNGYHYTTFRSTDFGETWTDEVDVTGSDPGAGLGYNTQSYGSWYRDWYYTDGSYSQSMPRGDGLRYLGGTMWVYAFQDNGLHIFSDDDGLTWHNPGSSFMSDATAHRLPTFGDPNIEAYYASHWLSYDSLYHGDMGTNWSVGSADGPFRALCSSPPSSPRLVYGTSATKVCPTASVGGNQFNIAAELMSQDTSQGAYWRAGIPPYQSEGSQFQIYGRGGLPSASSFRFVPGTGGNVWLYSGGETGYSDYRIARVNEAFGPSTILKATGSSHYVVSQAFQQNIYTGWAYGGSPSAKGISGGQVAVTPHPTTSGAWRAWFIDGLCSFYGSYACTICYSDDQGSSWTTEADYSQGGASSRAQWLAKGQHPFFYPDYIGYYNWVMDIAFHPSDPKTLLSIGRAGSTLNWCQAASYDGGQTWDDLVQFPTYANNGPNKVARLVVMYTAPGTMAALGQSREIVDAHGIVLHAPAAVGHNGTVVVGAAAAVLSAPELLAPQGGAATVPGASTVVVAPRVTTDPAQPGVGAAGMVLVAPQVGVLGAVSVAAQVVVWAPAAIGYQEAALHHYREAGTTALVLHAPAVTHNYRAATAGMVVAHAPATG